jgi:hypothetical protein
MPRLLTDRFGLSFTRAECYCGSTLNASGSVGTSAADSVCQAVACPGDTLQACGGPWRMRLFRSGTTTTSASSSTPTASSTSTAVPPGWQLQGCGLSFGFIICHVAAPRAPQPGADRQGLSDTRRRRRRRLGSAAYWVLHEPQVDQLARGLHRSLRCWRLHLRRSRERRPCVPNRLSQDASAPDPNADVRAQRPCTTRMLLRLEAQRLRKRRLICPRLSLSSRRLSGRRDASVRWFLASAAL